MGPRHARLLGGLAGVVLACALAAAAAPEPTHVAGYRDVAEKLIQAARADHFAWERIAELTDTFGPRLAGSAGLQAALAWGADEMKRDGLENVRLEPVRVPRWVRGRESLEIVEPFPSSLVMIGLGNSVGTPPAGILAELLLVRDFDELEARSAEVRGRIVFFNAAFTSYGESVRYRSTGASRAARHGALAAIIRAVGPVGLRTPHTGALSYDAGAPKIAAAAVAAEDANRLQRIHGRGRRIVLRLKMEAEQLPDADSANLVGEIRGRETPDEIVLLGGHIDSWDPGTGAMDDAGGVIATWDALRLIRKLGLRPRRTLRVVGFTNEENGLRGAYGYRDAHSAEIERHVLALESDGGAFRLRGFGFSGPEAARAVLEQIARLLEPIGAARLDGGGGGADIAPLAQAATAAGLELPLLSPIVDGERYFVYHHTPADTVERLDPEDVSSCVAGIAVMAYVVADLPVRLGR